MRQPSERDEYELPDEYEFAGKPAMRGRFYSPKKKSVTIRLDDDVVLYFRSQSLINATLRERMNGPQ